MLESDGFVLLTLPNCTLSVSGRSFTGTLELDCVTANHSVILVLRLDSFESPIDPSKPIHLQCASDSLPRTYTIVTASDSPVSLVLTPPINTNDAEYYMEDVHTFEGVLAQYADFRISEKHSELMDIKRPVPPPPANAQPPNYTRSAPPSHPTQVRSPPPKDTGYMAAPPLHPNQIQMPIPQTTAPPIHSTELNDYKGHLVLVNEESGHVVGQFDDKLHVKEDPTLLQRGHENDQVVIEVNGGEGQESARECFVRAIPPEQHDWMTKGATIASYAITTGTNILTATISGASNYYIKNSKHSQHHTSAPTTTSRTVSGTASGSNSGVGVQDDSPKPPMFVTMLTSQQTHKNMHRIHAASGQAVKVSSKTMGLVDDLVKRAVGSKPKKKDPGLQTQGMISPGPQPYSTSPTSEMPPSSQMPRSLSPLPNGGPSYSPYQGSSRANSPLPPSYPNSEYSKSVQSITPQPLTTSPPPLPSRTKLSLPKRVILSADVILSTLDESGKKLLEVSGKELSNVMGHKYGKEAAESTAMITGSARNVALVYVDMKGVGRRALLKRVGREYVHGKMRKD